MTMTPERERIIADLTREQQRLSNHAATLTRMTDGIGLVIERLHEPDLAPEELPSARAIVERMQAVKLLDSEPQSTGKHGLGAGVASAFIGPFIGAEVTN